MSLLVEALQVSPRLVFWTAALAQALLWTLVPALFYFAPPGDAAEVLAIGHQWRLGETRAPPLAYLLANAAFELTGRRMIGVYLLSQLCVVVTYWAVFALGLSIVGARQAVVAVLLMVGIYPLAAPTPDFGPQVLAMPLSALALLFYWRAVGEGRRGYWPLLAVTLGLLVLTSYAGLVLLGIMVVFTVATAHGRAAMKSLDAAAAAVAMALIAGPYLIWVDRAYEPLLEVTADGAREMPRLIGMLALAQLGLIFLACAGGLPEKRRVHSPVIQRASVERFARSFVYTFALAPGVMAAAAAALLGQDLSLGAMAPHVVLSGLAVVIAAGDALRLYRQHVLGVCWLALLVGPAVLAVAAVLLLPWTFAIALPVNEPAAVMGRVFTESFQRRTGRPLAIVAGDARLASLVALASPDRPRVALDSVPDRGLSVSDAEIREKGAIVLWPITGSTTAPPAAIRARFPNLVAEVPQTFDRPIQGFLSPMRVGWSVIRPQVSNPQGGQ